MKAGEGSRSAGINEEPAPLVTFGAVIVGRATDTLPTRPMSIPGNRLSVSIAKLTPFIIPLIIVSIVSKTVDATLITTLLIETKASRNLKIIVMTGLIALARISKATFRVTPKTGATLSLMNP